MDLKLTNFVKINIKNHVSYGVSGSYDTAILIHYLDTLAGDDPAIQLLDGSTTPNARLNGIKDYIDAFFNNGGAKLYVISTKTLASVANLKTLLDAAPINYIVVGMVSDPNCTTAKTEALFRTYAAGYNEAYVNEKLYQKLFVCEGLYSAGTTADLVEANTENYVLKYGKLGISASVLAYLTRIDINSANAAQDYAFTSESYSELATDGFVFNDNDLVTTAMADNINIDSKLAGNVRNLGGNDTKGYDLVNQFMLLVLHHELTNALTNVLVSKIKYDTYGSALVMNVTMRELEKFVANGYLATNKVWTNGDLYYKGYSIIEDNTVLSEGYKVVMLPFSSLSDEEKAAHQLPELYVLIADMYGIRSIVVNGEAF